MSNLGDLVITQNHYEGYTIREVLDEANMALAGMKTDHNIRSLAKMVAWINLYFNEHMDDKMNDLPELFACP